MSQADHPFMQAVEAYRQARRCSAGEAVAAVAKADSSLHQSFLDAARSSATPSTRELHPFQAAVDAHASERHVSRAAAAVAVAKEQPDLHAAFISHANGYRFAPAV